MAQEITEWDDEKLAMTIREFSDRHGISVAMFYKMKKDGKTPREFRCGSKALISRESAAEWRVARENDAEATAKAEKTWTKSRAGKKAAFDLTKPRKTKHRPKPRAKHEVA